MRPLYAARTANLEEAGAGGLLLDLATQGKLFERQAPLFCDKRIEYVAQLRDVAHLMQDCDGSWYKGVKPWSFCIRIGTMGVPSHGGLLFNINNHIQNIDSCEGYGVRNTWFADQVRAEHSQSFLKGQWYWGPMDKYYRDQLLSNTAQEFALSYVGKPYGKYALYYMAMFLMPGIRVFAFLRHHADLTTDWEDYGAPYCSMFQSLVLQKSSSLDPCPGRALQLTSPQDTWQSLMWPVKVALVP